MQITNLGGHSGCEILLFENEDNSVYVRKISSSKEYNKRLAIQAKKQEEFILPNIKAPQVFNDGYTENGLYYFDMEYIQGITLAEYMKSVRIGDVRKIVETIVSEIVIQARKSQIHNDSAFREKIAMLNQELKGKDRIIDEALLLLSNHSWDSFTESFCHGDLTLENVIVKDNQLYLIDFLDSFYDCWIFDISTLLQDVQTLWAYRNEDKMNINTIIRLIVFRDILMDTVKKTSPENYYEVYYALLLKLLRIIPYAKNDHTYNFLLNKTSSVMEIIHKGGVE